LLIKIILYCISWSQLSQLHKTCNFSTFLWMLTVYINNRLSCLHCLTTRLGINFFQTKWNATIFLFFAIGTCLHRQLLFITTLHSNILRSTFLLQIWHDNLCTINAYNNDIWHGFFNNSLRVYDIFLLRKNTKRIITQMTVAAVLRVGSPRVKHDQIRTLTQ